eukprot:8764311-Alexandrium_andersonii.AAC.1
MHAVEALLGVREVLCAAWNMHTYLGGGGHEEDRDGKGVNVRIASSAINNKFFWAYARMVDLLAECLLAISAFGEQCPCHDRELPA